MTIDMPPAQICIPEIKTLLGRLTNAQYNSVRAALYFIVSTRCYHLWIYNRQDRSEIWFLIYQILHTIIPAIPLPGPAVVVPSAILMGVCYLFIVYQKHLLSNKKAMWKAYLNENDHCALAWHNCYICHYRGIYARNLAQTTEICGIPMGIPVPDFPTLPISPQYLPMMAGNLIARERGPPHTISTHNLLCLPPPLHSRTQPIRGCSSHQTSYILRVCGQASLEAQQLVISQLHQQPQ